MKKTKIAPTVRLRAYSIIARAVEEGLKYGYQRAHKYNDRPAEGLLLEYLESAVLNELCEVLDFDSPAE